VDSWGNTLATASRKIESRFHALVALVVLRYLYLVSAWGCDLSSWSWVDNFGVIQSGLVS
jgi:hypothetical protein